MSKDKYNMSHAEERNAVADDDYEESIVVVDLDGLVDDKWVEAAGGNAKFVGLDTNSPFLQLGPYVFQGEFRDDPGSVIVLEEYEKNGEKSQTGLKFNCHTHKRLAMHRVFLSEKQAADQEQLGEQTEAAGTSSSAAVQMNVDSLVQADADSNIGPEDSASEFGGT